ncbi:MAG TPA: hypothetical protein VFA59_06970 [Vicinamibacterales bacterium]|nr:hypothetical protein [Vicinamibacterales bacterium]
MGVVIVPRIAAASAIFEDVPVTGGTAALAQLLSVDSPPDRGRFMYEMTRIILDNDPRRSPEWLAARLKQRSTSRQSPADSRQTESVPVPLNANWWADHVFHRRVSRDELVTAILSDRNASLICHGLGALDDETLQYFADHGSLISHLIEKLAAPAFGVFSSGLHIRANRVEVPGGDEAAAMWEAVLLEKTSRPDRFVELLFETNDGRLAHLYDVIGQLDPPRRAFTLGTWMPTAAARLERFKALATVGITAFREWHLKTQPFGRASYDLGMTLERLEVDETGAPAVALTRGFWSRALTGHDAGADDEQPLDAAWLSEVIGSADVRQRAERLDQLSFGQRLARATTIATDADRADAQLAVRSFPRVRMLALSLERIGIRQPSIYATAVHLAARLATVDGRHGLLVQSQLQGVLVIITRATIAGSLDATRAEALVAQLLAVPISDDGRYAGALAKWIRDDLARALPPSTDVESAVIAALAGSSASRPAMVTWEGQQYRLDLAGSERQRLRRVREKQDALRIDVALDVSDLARSMIKDPSTASTAAERLTTLAEDVPQRLRENELENVAAGVGIPPSHHESLKKSIDEITKAARAKDSKRVVRAADGLVELADDMLAGSLVSFAYAADIGDPEGTVLLAEDVSRRHDFGFGIRDGDVRQRTAWMAPRQEVVPNVPWHVTGSLLGLDIALAPLALRRVSTDGVLEAPRLTSPERDAFMLSVSLMNPYVLVDRDRDAIADAITRGTQRVQLMTAATFDAVADQIAMDAARRRSLRWTLDHDAPRVVSMFSMTELLVIGGGKPADFAPWGMAVAAPFGCFCTRLTTPGQWLPLAGRPQLGLIAAVVSDLNLHIAVMLKQMQLPAPLARVVLSGAMQDFIDAARPSDPGDWLTLSRAARSLTRDRIEDYVAAATASGPLMPVAAGQQ